MITILNRKQLIITYDMILQSKIRDILACNNIEYSVNPVRIANGMGSAEYKIYVKKQDYDKACFIIKSVYR